MTEYKLLEQRLDQIEVKIDVLCKAVMGNGDPAKGIIVRLDRIEQAEARRRWLMRACLGSAIAALVAAGAKLIGW